MTCTEADRVKREGPTLTVERMDGVARVILTCSVDHADIIKARWEQLRCVRQLAEGHPEQAGLKLGASDNLREELEIVYGLFSRPPIPNTCTCKWCKGLPEWPESFGEAGPQAPETVPQRVGIAAARAPNYYVDGRHVMPHTELEGAGL